MMNHRKMLAVIFAAIFSICAALCVGAAENEDVRITVNALGDHELEIELENISDYYIGNVKIDIKDSDGQTIRVAEKETTAASESDAVTVTATETETVASGADGEADEKSYEGAGFFRSVAPGETVSLYAALDYGDDSVTIMPAEEIPPSTLWIAIGVVVVLAVIAVIIVRGKKKSKGVSAMLVFALLLGSFSFVGYADTGVDTSYVSETEAYDTDTAAESTEESAAVTETETELEESYDAGISETVSLSGGKGDITVTAEYTVVPHAKTYPMKNAAPEHENAEYNTPAVREHRLFENSGPMTEHKIYIGENGFMFQGQEIDDYTGASVLSDAQVQRISKMMSDRDEWAKENGIKMYLVICPNKATVYPEYVPDKIGEQAKSATDHVVEYLEENCSVEIIDLRDTIISAKEEYGDGLFYKADTHWNNTGGFVAYSELIRRISEDMDGVITLEKDDFTIEEYETYMRDMAYNLGYYSRYKEYGPVYTLKSGMTADLTDTTRQKYAAGQFNFCKTWDNGYSDALQNVVFTNKYNEDAPSLYMCRDSFSVALLHFLKDSFYESEFNWSFDFNRKEILESGADVVIYEFVEKQLPAVLEARTFAG